MKSMLRLLVALLLVGGWSLAALALHVIIAPGAGGGSLPVRIIVLPKDHLGVAETYVDTQHWTIDDVSNHPVVAKRLLAAGKADALQHVVKPDPAGADLQSALADAIARGPQTPTSAPAVIETRGDATQAAAHATTTTSNKRAARRVNH